MKKRFLGVLLASGVAGTAVAGSGQIVLELKEPSEVRAAQFSRTLGQTSKVWVARTLGRGRFLVLDAGKAERAAAALQTARALPDVVEAVRPWTYRLAQTFPNDPDFAPGQWALHNTGQSVTMPDPSDPSQNITIRGIADADIDAPEAWDIETGSSAVVVAVIDTGFPLSNPDLAPNVWTNPGEIAGDGIDNDNNGYIDDLNGWNFFADNANIADDHGHGSFCSGIIGARTNNGIGVAGINWDVSIMGLKAFGADGTSMDVELAAAIDYATDNGAHAINASWGDYYASPLIENAIRRARDAGVIFVAATGDDARNMTEVPHYPAAFDLENVVAAGATDIADRWALFSNFDDTVVHVHAPGENVFSTRQSTYEFGSGTSFAAPQAAGIAALLVAQDPTAAPEVIRRRLIAGFDAREDLAGRSLTAGRVSASKALSAHLADTTPPAAVTDLRVEETASNGVRLAFTATGDDGASGRPVAYTMERTIAGEPESRWRVRGLPEPPPAGEAVAVYVTGLEADTAYEFRLRALDEAGNISPSASVTAVTDPVTIVLADNAETDSGLWTFANGFARTQEAAHRGSWSFTDSPGGEYPRNNVATMTSAPIDLSSTQNPQLTFWHQFLLEPSFTQPNDVCQVQVSLDATTFTTLEQYVDFRHPFHFARVSLAEYAGQPSVTLRFRMRGDFIDREILGDGWHLDEIVLSDPGSLLPEPLVIAMESTDRYGELTPEPNYTEESTGDFWRTDFNTARLADVRSRRSRYKPIAALGGTALFTPAFLAGGRYRVEVAWGDNANASNVRYEVRHADGTAETFLTQDSRTNGHAWQTLGTFDFAAGQSEATGSLLVDDSTVTGAPNGALAGRLYVDVVRFVFEGPPGSREATRWFVR